MSNTVATPAPSKAAIERKRHGAEAACQLIGHLGTPKAGASEAQVLQREGKHPMLWTTLAVNRGEGFAPSWWFVNIYPVADENGNRASADDLRALAARMAKGRRIRIQGAPELRQSEESYDVGGKTIRDVTGAVKVFATPADVAFALDESNDDAPGRRPITFLPRLGTSEPDVGF